jgi:hypothetical protein
MRDNPEPVLKIVHLYRDNPKSTSTFMAFFRELNSLDQITAILNAWGTFFSPSGERPRAYGAIRSAIEDLELPFEQHHWRVFAL